jgi:hypothetical protein
MRSWLAGLSTIGTLGSLSAALPSTSTGFAPAGAAPFIECGGGAEGVPGVVVVHLLDAGRILHWSMQLEAKPHQGTTLELSGPGTIKIEVQREGRPSACEATAPSPFHVRAVAARLAGAALRVFANEPVPVEIRNRSGKLLARQTANSKQATSVSIGW